MLLVEHGEQGSAVFGEDVRGLRARHLDELLGQALQCLGAGFHPDPGEGGERIGQAGDHESRDQAGTDEGNDLSGSHTSKV